MDDDQQFCLRWNNHQSTLVAVFDSLLERDILVDCTLAAEGKCLKAHKVVLSACSPYFESLFAQHYDKHPILILSDVKYQELKAMMDYMYRGEVNISQDQLGALLKAASTLQIKGLADSRKSEPSERLTAPPPHQQNVKSPLSQTVIPAKVQDDDPSPAHVPRKKRAIRRTSDDILLDNNNDKRSMTTTATTTTTGSGTVDSHLTSTGATSPHIPTTLPFTNTTTAPTTTTTDVPMIDSMEAKGSISSENFTTATTTPASSSSIKQSTAASATTAITAATESEAATASEQVPMLDDDIDTNTELILEPKSEQMEENDDSVEDLTLDDDDEELSGMDSTMVIGAGPSHGNGGSNQGFTGWHVGANQSQDEVFLAAQEAVGAHRDPQGVIFYANSSDDYKNLKVYQHYGVRYGCGRCKKTYLQKKTLGRHLRFDCGKMPSFTCQLCAKKFKHGYILLKHIRIQHEIFIEKLRKRHQQQQFIKKEEPLEEGGGGGFLDEDDDDIEENLPLPPSLAPTIIIE